MKDNVVYIPGGPMLVNGNPVTLELLYQKHVDLESKFNDMLEWLMAIAKQVGVAEVM